MAYKFCCYGQLSPSKTVRAVLVFIGSISRHSQSQKCIQHGDLGTLYLLLANDLVLLASLGDDFQHALERFTAQYKMARITISTLCIWMAEVAL